MNALTLKIIACLAMAISHFGGVFWAVLPPALADGLYYAGRLCFPVFAYLVAEGWRHTADKSRYMLRLLVFAALSQLPYALALCGSFLSDLNVLFTLFLGTCALRLEDLARDRTGARRWLLMLLCLLPVSVGFLTGLDFGWQGVLCVALLGLTENKPLRLAILAGSMALVYLPGFSLFYVIAFLCTFPAILLLYLYNGERGRIRCKYLFYGFYPAHLLLFYCIYRLLC